MDHLTEHTGTALPSRSVNDSAGNDPDGSSDQLPPQEMTYDRSTLHDDGSPPWPKLPPIALYGPAGEFVRNVAPHTEADPAALLFDSLTYDGTVFSPYAVGLSLGNARHRPTLFVAIIGQTAKARKGTASRQVSEVVELVDPSSRSITASVGSAAVRL